MNSPRPEAPFQPRLREAHAHVASYGRSLSMPSMADCRSREECLDRLRHASGRASASAGESSRGTPESWFLAHSLHVESWSDPRPPTRAELDRIFGDRACAIMSFDHHAASVNTPAMIAAGLSPHAPDPPGGVIVRDATGQATGLMLESAAHRVWNAAPEPTHAERREHVRRALVALAEHGFVEVHDLLAPSWLGPILADLFDRGALTMRVELFAPIDELEPQHASAKSWTRPDVRLAGGKLFADGTLNSRTAWMLHPFRDALPDLPRGKALKTKAEIADALSRCRRLGLQLAVHAIGDAAVRACLDAAEDTALSSPHASMPHASLPSSPSPSSASSLRIEHAELIDEADVPRFARLGVTASVQPCHLLCDVEALTRYLPHRLHRVLPLRDLIDSGLTPGRDLIFGSDVPIVRPDPGDSIQAAVHRRRVEMSSGEAIAPAQAITAEEARSAFRPAD